MDEQRLREIGVDSIEYLTDKIQDEIDELEDDINARFVQIRQRYADMVMARFYENQMAAKELRDHATQDIEHYQREIRELQKKLDWQKQLLAKVQTLKPEDFAGVQRFLPAP